MNFVRTFRDRNLFDARRELQCEVHANGAVGVHLDRGLSYGLKSCPCDLDIIGADRKPRKVVKTFLVRRALT
jgi:hypothetical protein